MKKFMDFMIRVMTPDRIVIEDGTIIFDKNDPVMSGWLTLGEYEPETVAIFRSIIKDGMNVLDIGANLGYFTVIAASRVGKNGKIIAYEPDPHNLVFLKRNIEFNKFKNVSVLSTAVSDRAGTRELFFGDNQCTHSFSDNRQTGSSETVTTDTLDHSLETLGISRVDVIKIDIEGAELLALDGMKKTLANNPDIVVLFELYPRAIKRLNQKPIDLLLKFKDQGFETFLIDEDRGEPIILTDYEKFITDFPDNESVRNFIATKNKNAKFIHNTENNR